MYVFHVETTYYSRQLRPLGTELVAATTWYCQYTRTTKALSVIILLQGYKVDSYVVLKQWQLDIRDYQGFRSIDFFESFYIKFISNSKVEFFFQFEPDLV